MMKTASVFARNLNGFLDGNPTRVHLVSDRANPAEIRMTVQHSEWSWSRGLLNGAVDSWDAPVGEPGFQRAWATNAWGRQVLRMDLFGEAVVDVPLAGMCAFLHGDGMTLAEENETVTASVDTVSAWLSPCPVCRELACLDAGHLQIREDIRADAAQVRNEDVTNE